MVVDAVRHKNYRSSFTYKQTGLDRIISILYLEAPRVYEQDHHHLSLDRGKMHPRFSKTKDVLLLFGLSVVMVQVKVGRESMGHTGTVPYTTRKSYIEHKHRLYH